MIGAGAIVAGGPLGAVEIGGVERRRRDAYVMATELNGSLETRLTALGTGMALGAALSTALVARRPADRGLVRYGSGRWNLGAPTVRVRPRGGAGRSSSVEVTLMTAHF